MPNFKFTYKPLNLSTELYLYMYWIDKLLPSCCKTRQNPPESIMRSSSTIPDIQITPLQESPTIIYEERLKPNITSSNSVKIENLSQIELLKAPELSQDFTDSRRSTGFTAASAEHLVPVPATPDPGTIICSYCNKETQGFCPACPFKRYCSGCYEMIHTDKQKFHLFVAYSLQKKGTIKDFENLAKIKKIK